jgi:pSer/pThr/pTyr-binding forkhead associated (FHA) protein/ribosomal protein S27E
MIKINCNNSICGEVYYFNNDKFPNATKVKCPKCGQVQARPTAGGAPAIEANDDIDWFKPKEKPIEASPQMIYDTPQVSSGFFDDAQPSASAAEEEDFFTPIKKPAVNTPPPSPIKHQAPPTYSSPPPSNVPDAIGWLVIHDEYTESRTFSLRKGLNRIGRVSDSTPRDVNICIDTQDNYMSRHHCDIEVRQKPGTNGYEYILSDRDYGGKKASANGTFLNARKRLSPNDESPLQDNDTIQVGRTKVVLKLPSVAQNAQDAATKVQQMDFFQTIIN